MKKLLLILRPSMLATFGLNKARYTKDNKERSKATGFVVLMVVAGILILFAAFAIFLGIGLALQGTPFLDLLPALAMIISTITTLLFTLFKASGILFNFNDYELLMSLPINSGTIIASRILNLYSFNVLFCIGVMLPANIIYGILSAQGVGYYVLSTIFMFLVPIIPIVIASFVGLLIALATSKLKKKTAIQTIVTFALFFGFFLLYANIGNFVSGIELIAGDLLKTLTAVYPVSFWYLNAITTFSVPDLILFIALNAVVFFAFVLIVGKYYKKINTYVSTVKTSGNYKLGTLEATSPKKALFKREWKRYTSSTMYIFNTSVGVLFLIIGGFALIFFGTDFLALVFSGEAGMQFITPLAPIGISVLIALTCTTCCSVSLDGKTLWILRSLPVDTMQVLRSKIRVNLTLTLPAIAFASTVCCIVLKPALDLCILMYVLPVLYTIFTAYLGLWIDLNHAVLDWENEVKVIKQSRSTMMATFIALGASAVPALLTLFFGSFVMYIALVAVLAVDIWLYMSIQKKGVMLYENL